MLSFQNTYEGTNAAEGFWKGLGIGSGIVTQLSTPKQMPKAKVMIANKFMLCVLIEVQIISE